MAKLNSKKIEKFCVYKKNLVGSTPEVRSFGSNKMWEWWKIIWQKRREIFFWDGICQQFLLLLKIVRIFSLKTMHSISFLLGRCDLEKSTGKNWPFQMHSFWFVKCINSFLAFNVSINCSSHWHQFGIALNKKISKAVKPEITTTSELRPLAYNEHYFGVPMVTTMTTCQQLTLFRSHCWLLYSSWFYSVTD